MKARLVIALVVGAAVLGGGAVFVAEQMYWSGELKVQLAEKDRLMAQLREDADGLRQSLEALEKTNAEMRGLIDASLSDASDIAKSNRSSLEKLRSVIQRLEGLRATMNPSLP